MRLELDTACAMVTLHSWTHSNSWVPQEQYTPAAAVPAPAALILDSELLKTTGKEKKTQAKTQLM